MPRNTISDKKMAELQRRAQKAQKESMFSKRQVAKRLASNDQRKKSRWS
jgi:hypothetical protein